MADKGFTLLWSSMLQSSIWLETPATRCVWFTLLMMKDETGMVRTPSVKVIAHTANVSEEEARKAIEKFLAPDKDSHKNFEGDDGRRLKQVVGGYQVLNHEMYRYSDPVKREYWRIKQAEHRERKARRLELARQGRLREPRNRKSSGHGQLKGEEGYQKAVKNGAKEAELDRIVNNNLPDEGKF